MLKMQGSLWRISLRTLSSYNLSSEPLQGYCTHISYSCQALDYSV